MKPLIGLLLLIATCFSAPDPDSGPIATDYISTWLVAGPFPNGYGGSQGPHCLGYYRDLLAAQGGEAGIDPCEGQTLSFDGVSTYDWRIAATDTNGILDFLAAFEVDDRTPYVAYAFCHLLAADVVKKWNETYQWPSLRLATAHGFLDYVEKEHGLDLQTIRAAWPAVNMSLSPFETKFIRLLLE